MSCGWVTLFNHLIKLLYQLNNTILQYIQHPNFYFPILLIKIIFLHNKIIYLKIIIIYNTIHYLFSLSFLLFKNDHKFTKTTIITSPPLLHYTHLTPPLLHYTYLTPPPPPPSWAKPKPTMANSCRCRQPGRFEWE